MGAGPRFGRYEVLKHLASGGMAEVYLARTCGDGGFMRHLVIKAMRPSPGLDGTFARMFLDEARLAAVLHHQHIAQVYDLGTAADGSYFLAMEYVHGETLRNVMGVARARSLPLPPGFGVAVAAAVASALAYAHERTDERGLPLAIVHRDVTPANILVGHDGAVKLIDFGIAKAVARTSRTATGVVKGKAGYMAPEQVLNLPLDARTDVFALGIVLYELTTQERLFAGVTDYESAQRCVAAEVPRPSRVCRGYPRALEGVVLTALCREPGGRFATARAMGAALIDAAARDGLDAHPGIVERVVGALFGVKPEPWQRVPAAGEDEEDEGTTERRPGGIGSTAAAEGAMLTLPLREGPSGTLAREIEVHAFGVHAPEVHAPDAHEPASSWLDESAPEPIELPPRPGTPPPARANTLAMHEHRRWKWVAAATASAVGVAIGLVVSITVPDPQPPQPQPPQQPQPQPQPQPHPQPQPQPQAARPSPVPVPVPVPPTPISTPPPRSSRVHVRVTTTPEDATVVIDGTRMGRTPFDGTFAPRGEQVWLKVRKRGFVPRKVKVTVTPEMEWDVRLPKR